MLQDNSNRIANEMTEQDSLILIESIDAATKEAYKRGHIGPDVAAMQMLRKRLAAHINTLQQTKKQNGERPRQWASLPAIYTSIPRALYVSNTQAGQRAIFSVTRSFDGSESIVHFNLSLQ